MSESFVIFVRFVVGSNSLDKLRELRKPSGLRLTRILELRDSSPWLAF
jgi:hypothetical protein